MKTTAWSRCAALGLGLVALASPVASAGGACLQPPPGARVISEGGVRAAWVAQPAPEVGRPFALQVFLCPEQAELVRVDAQMPEHRHGMNYRTSLKHVGQGLWRVEGLLWHMSGRWELRLDVRHQDVQHRLLQSVQLP